MNITIRVVKDINEFWDFENEYRLFSKKINLTNPFLSWEWLSSWVAIYGEKVNVYLVSIYNHSELIGIFPLCFSSSEQKPTKINLRFLGDRFVSSEYLDCLVENKNRQIVIETFLNFLSSTKKRYNLFFDDILSNSSLYSMLFELSGKTKYEFVAHKKNVCPILSFADLNYKNESIASQYKLAKSKIKKLNKKYSSTIKIFENETNLNQQLNDFINLHQKLWQFKGEPGSFVTFEKKQFYRLIIDEFSKNKWLSFFTLKISDQPVSSFLGFTLGKTFYYLQSGYDPDYSEHSIGTAFFYQIIEILKNRGIEKIDFLRGNESYKYRWGAKPRFSYSIFGTSRSFLNKPSFVLKNIKWKIKERVEVEQFQVPEI